MARRVFFGLADAPGEDAQIAEQSSEETGATEGTNERTPLSMPVPVAVLVALAVAVGVMPHLGPLAHASAIHFQDQEAYNAVVLFGSHITNPVSPAASEPAGVTIADVAAGAAPPWCPGSGIRWPIYCRSIPVLRRGGESGAWIVEPAGPFQSGVVNDYVTWMVIGTASLGAALAFSLR